MFFFVFFLLLFVFLEGLRVNVRWPEGPPHLALNPPYFILFLFFLLCFVFFVFVCFFGGFMYGSV